MSSRRKGPHWFGLLAVSTALATAWACSHSPTAPETTLGAGPSGAVMDESGGARASAAAADGNQPPFAVFRTRPRADSEGVIAGGSSFVVTFNLCQTRDYDVGDELRFSYDFDGDGTVDELGHCRATHRYEVAPFESACFKAVACVTDRQPDHKICQTYEVCANGRAQEPAPPGPPDPEVFEEQHVEGDFPPIGGTDGWAFTAEPGTRVSFELDTVSAASAYWMTACISTDSTWSGCIPPESRGRTPCSFPPPGGLGCPYRTTVLPDLPGGVYYFMVGGLRFTQNEGLYTAVVRANPGIGELDLIRNSGEGPAFIEP